MPFDPRPLQAILDQAAAEGRSCLLEHEVYQFLELAGCVVPRFLFVTPGQQLDDAALRQLDPAHVYLKVVSPAIAHKTDVGGVERVAATAEAVQAAIGRMLEQVPTRYVEWLARHPELKPEGFENLAADQVARSVRESIRGFLLVQPIVAEGKGPGSELLAGLRHNREFGPVLTLGVGGVDTELLSAACHKGLAVVTGSPLMMTDAQLLDLMRPTLAYQRLTGKTRERKVLVTDDTLRAAIAAFCRIAEHFGSDGKPGCWTVTELEVNPFTASAGQLVALDGLLKFRRSTELAPERPDDSIRALLHPRSLAVVGASAKSMNMGRIILRNVLEAGFDRSRAYAIHPSATEIEGVRCFADVQSLPERVDVLVLAVAADQVPDVMEALVEHDKAVGVILIAGGMGEKAGGESIEARVKRAIASAREQSRPLVVNGGNSLGVVSRPGHYHTLFIPTNKLPLRLDGKSNVAFLSQSGAYMISRLSRLDWMSPRFAVSTGNQVDLTVTDYLRFLSDDPAVHTFAVYAEGFKDADGLAFARAVRMAIQKGKDVIFYKAGRTTEGKSATSGHTASVAGEYDVCESIAREAGALIARTFPEFLDLLKVSSLMGDRNWSGRRLAAMSNAGYETVGIADSVRGEGYNLQLAKLQPATREALSQALVKGRLDGLVDVRNPLDITPMGNDETHELVVRAFLQDPEVDIVLCASVPLTPAMATLAEGVPEEKSIRSEGSLVNRLGRLAKESNKPLAACIDSGVLYDPLVRALEDRGIPTFRSADDAMRTLGLYAEMRLARARG